MLSHRRHVLAGICGILAYRAPPTNRPAFPVDSVAGSEWEGRACIGCHTLWVALSGQSFKVCYKCHISNVFIYIDHLHTNTHICKKNSFTYKHSYLKNIFLIISLALSGVKQALHYKLSVAVLSPNVSLCYNNCVFFLFLSFLSPIPLSCYPPAHLHLYFTCFGLHAVAAKGRHNTVPTKAPGERTSDRGQRTGVHHSGKLCCARSRGLCSTLFIYEFVVPPSTH